MESSLIKSMKIDHWTTFIMLLGFIAIATALKMEVKVITNLDLLLVGVGILLIGLGEKFNYEWTTFIVPANIYLTGGHTLMGEGYTRKNKISGIIFDLSGVTLIVYRVYKIMQYT